MLRETITPSPTEAKETLKEQALEMCCSSFFMWEGLFRCLSRSEDSYLSWSFPSIGGSWDGSPVFSPGSNGLHLLADLDHSLEAISF